MHPNPQLGLPFAAVPTTVPTRDVRVVHDHFGGHVGQRAAQVVHVGAERVILVLAQPKVGLQRKGHEGGTRGQSGASSEHSTDARRGHRDGPRPSSPRIPASVACSAVRMRDLVPAKTHHFDRGALLAAPVAVHQQVVWLDVEMDHLWHNSRRCERGGHTGRQIGKRVNRCLAKH